MRLLLDTHILLWVAESDAVGGNRLSQLGADLIDDPENTLVFSVASIWEVAIKYGLGRKDFPTDPRSLRRGLLSNGYGELTVIGEHAMAVGQLPNLHKDPFDRLLIAQAIFEGLTLLTSDAVIAAYPGPILRV